MEGTRLHLRIPQTWIKSRVAHSNASQNWEQIKNANGMRREILLSLPRVVYKRYDGYSYDTTSHFSKVGQWAAQSSSQTLQITLAQWLLPILPYAENGTTLLIEFYQSIKCNWRCRMLDSLTKRCHLISTASCCKFTEYFQQIHDRMSTDHLQNTLDLPGYQANLPKLRCLHPVVETLLAEVQTVINNPRASCTSVLDDLSQEQRRHPEGHHLNCLCNEIIATSDKGQFEHKCIQWKTLGILVAQAPIGLDAVELLEDSS